MDKKIVLQKYMADSGLASRRKCEEIIANGKVKINGKTAKLGDRVSPEVDIVTLQGKKIKLTKKNKLYIMLNKPRGYVTTMHDKHAKKCVSELISDIKERIYPVGRLDKDSEGLLILTNDGDFANSLIHPSKNVFKTYRVTVKPNVNEEMLIKLSSKMVIDDFETQPAQVELITSEPGRSVLKISIKEGRNRQIRKMCESVGLNVARLKRISIGNIKLGMLPTGKWRNLKDEEVKNLKYIKSISK